MQTKPHAVFVSAMVLTLSAAIPCFAASRSLSKAQVRAAPKDNPGVTTVGGYLEEVSLKGSDGKPLTGKTQKALTGVSADHGVQKRTVWMDEKGVGTWQASAAINDDGSFSEDTVITGMNGNEGRTEMRKKGQLPPAPQQPRDAVKAASRQTADNMIPDNVMADAEKVFADGRDYYLWQDEGSKTHLSQGVIRIDGLRYVRSPTSTNQMAIIRSRVQDAITSSDPRELEKAGTTSTIFFLQGSDITGGTGAIEVFFTDASGKKTISNILVAPMPAKQ
jgi:hypothetical protein